MPRDRHKIQEVNAGSMADIAFLMLIFFLVVTTMGTDSGLRRVLPPWTDQSHETPLIKRRNLFEVSINRLDEIWANGRIIPIGELSGAVKEFISNPAGSGELSESKEEIIEIIGKYGVSQGVIAIQSDPQTTYERYIEVQNELSRAYNELRDEASQKYFGARYTSLDNKRRAAVNSAIPIRISEVPTESAD